MSALSAVTRVFTRAALLAAVIVPGVVRAEDDVVKEAEPTPPPAQAPAFGGPFQGGRVIIMPGLRLQVGGQGQVQVQGAPRAPAARAPGEEGRKEPYLGVVAGPVPPAVRAQIDLPEGVGLSIDAVAAGSPAEKAGVRQFDVIRKFNDQVIVSPEQLTTLVKVVGAGTKVPLTLVRGGHDKVVEAVLEERVVPAEAGGDEIVGDVPGVLNLEQMIPPVAAGPLGPQVQAEIERKLAEALARAGAGGLPPGLVPGAIPGMPGNVRAQMLTIGPDAQSATVVSDARGTVEIRSAGGRKTVTVKDPTGKEVYSGPLDTHEDLEKVPEDHRDWVREIDGGQPVVEPPGPDADGDDPAEAPTAGPTT